MTRRQKTDEVVFYSSVAMTDEEADIINDLDTIWAKFRALPVLREWDKREFINAIHQAENIVLARTGFRSKNKRHIKTGNWEKA
jgi:hypothetical protein